MADSKLQAVGRALRSLGRQAMVQALAQGVFLALALAWLFTRKLCVPPGHGKVLHAPLQALPATCRPPTAAHPPRRRLPPSCACRALDAPSRPGSGHLRPNPRTPWP